MIEFSENQKNKQIKVLFLDDDEQRHMIAKKNLIGTDLTQVYTAKEAIDKLQSSSYDVVFLDHDLADHHYQNYDSSDEQTGQEVAKFIANHRNTHKNTVFVLHSLNPNGRAAMKNILKDCHVIEKPFAWQIVEVVGDTLYFDK